MGALTWNPFLLFFCKLLDFGEVSLCIWAMGWFKGKSAGFPRVFSHYTRGLSVHFPWNHSNDLGDGESLLLKAVRICNLWSCETGTVVNWDGRRWQEICLLWSAITASDQVRTLSDSAPLSFERESLGDARPSLFPHFTLYPAHDSYVPIGHYKLGDARKF